MATKPFTNTLFVSFSAALAKYSLLKQVEQDSCDWLIYLSTGLGKVRFDEYPLGNFGKMGIEGSIRNHSNIALGAFSKKVDVGLVIKAKILALLEGSP